MADGFNSVSVILTNPMNECIIRTGGIFGDEKRNLDENVIQKEWYAMTEFTRASKKWKHRIIIIIQLKR
ncbi:5437_t:CDS:2 [Entrophospora sp. SA101]|nr:5437_t:CDS:2 [Entrophospora sp. SA101]